MRVAGLGMIYASVFGIWLEDDDPGLARTMAALDRRLRRGERTCAAWSRSARRSTDWPPKDRASSARPLRGRDQAGAEPHGTDAAP